MMRAARLEAPMRARSLGPAGSARVESGFLRIRSSSVSRGRRPSNSRGVVAVDESLGGTDFQSTSAGFPFTRRRTGGKIPLAQKLRVFELAGRDDADLGRERPRTAEVLRREHELALADDPVAPERAASRLCCVSFGFNWSRRLL